jgi:DMSO/TMAO reductase YedYZ molybdopterin-dependent catalytic subunit
MTNADRIPPGQSLARKFPVLHYGPIPKVDTAGWDFRLWGEVKTPHGFGWEEFSTLPRTRLVMDIHCVTRWSLLDTEWEGVSIQTLCETGLLEILPTCTYVIQHAEYGFTANLPLSIVRAENFLLATHYNGKSLNPEHGYPLRGIVGAIPGKPELETPYFWKGAKWLRGLEFTSEDRPGFWEQAGYHNDANVWREERYA